MDRKQYLTRWTFKHYLIASIVTMAVLNLNGILDGILMGHLIGPDALAGINVCMPVINGIAAITILFANGSVILISKALGAHDMDTANRVFSVAIVSLGVVGILMGILAEFIKTPIANFLAIDSSLADEVTSYAGILIMFGIILMFQNALSMMVDVFGNPKVVTLSMTASVIINIICDLLYVGVFKVGLGGAAYATLTGALVSIIIFIIFIVKTPGTAKFVWNKSSFFSTLGENVARGIPGIIGTLSLTVMMLVCNYYVQLALGADGMFVMSICYSIISLGSMIANGIGMAYTGIGGMLTGQKDFSGLEILFKKGICVIFVLTLVVDVLITYYPGFVATMFGAETEELIAMAKKGLPYCAYFAFPLCMVTALSAIYQILDHALAATLDSILLLVLAIGSFSLAYYTEPSNIFRALLYAGLAVFVVVNIVCVCVYKKSKEKIHFYSFIPQIYKEPDRFDCSVEVRQDAIKTELEGVRIFLANNALNNITDKVQHTLEELSDNIVKYSGRGENHYFDIVLINDELELIVTIKDNGTPFNPIDCPEKKLGLLIVEHYCDAIEYSYQFGLNITTFKWIY